jgi:NADPH-dependent ferric siderophore reductase
VSTPTPLAGRLAGSYALSLTVDEVADLTPRLRAIWATGSLDGFDYEPGQDLMLSVPSGDDVIRRRYTIRRIDERGRLELWFVLHGHGPAATWAANATPGDTIDAIGPRGKVTVAADRDWHLFVGDESGLAAVVAMAEAVPDGQEAIVLVEVDSPADELDLDVPVRWVHRNGADAGDNDLLEQAVSRLDLPPGDGQAYLATEKATVKRLAAVLDGRGVDAGHRSPKGYWDVTRANAGHGEPLPDGWTGPDPGSQLQGMGMPGGAGPLP